MSTRVKIAEFGSYNRQRYIAPWLAILRLKDDMLEYDFRDGWEPNEEKGGGTLTAFLNEGDFIAYGQKDRFNKNTFRWYGEYRDGRLIERKKKDIEELLRIREEENGK